MSVIAHVRRQFTRYVQTYPGDIERLSDLSARLESDGRSLFDRSSMAGHVTASAFVLSPDHHEVLLIEHLALGRELQPGGHYEAHDTLIAEAMREVVEETGVRGLAPYFAGEPTPLDIDTHRIPANAKRGEGEHVHHDFLYLLIAGAKHDLTLQKDEVAGARWKPLAEIAADGGRLGRAAAKVKAILQDR